MNIKVQTHVLKSFDSDQNKFFINTIEYLSKIQKIDNQVKLCDNLNFSLDPNDFLIIFIDEIFLEQVTQNKLNNEFFLKKNYRNNQIVLILDDVELVNLPEFLQYFHTFTLRNANNMADDSGEIWNSNDENKSKIFEILNDIVLYVKRVKQGVNNDKLTIYIGPSDDNTTLEYQKITRELLHREYHIIPEISNPTGKELLENRAYFQSLLESADLSLHFIGHNSIYNFPEKKSSAIKINDLTAAFCSTEEGEMLQRIVYIPSENLENNEILNQKVLQFKSETQNLKNAELVQTPVEKFKEVILHKLDELSKPFAQKDQSDENIDDIYLIFPPGLEKDIVPYAEWFKKNKISYSLSQVDLDQLDLLHYHQKKLTNCKGVAIYYNGNKQWLNRKLSDIKKSPGWGRKEPFKLKAILGQEPELNNTNNYNSFLQINDLSQLDINNIRELLFE